MEKENSVGLFEAFKVRHIWQEGIVYFVVTDVVQALTDTPNPTDYLKKLRKRDPEIQKGWGQIVTPLSVPTEGGRQRVNCMSRENLLRFIMSIPSPKAEPFKKWLAQVGEQAIQEIENPELSLDRIRELYRAKGYADDWIERRLRSIEIRNTLTDEWKNRGVTEGGEYAHLTAAISTGTFDMNPTEYKNFKGLTEPKDNLRDHMTDLELVFTMLGEAATTELARNHDTQGFQQNLEAATEGGIIAGNARRELERKSGNKVSTPANFKHLKNKETAEIPENTEGALNNE
jgi:DNA-damage-inducible protein D